MADNPYGLSDSEIRQIDALAAAASKPNINLMAGMISGDPTTSNMASQIQAQQTRSGTQRAGMLQGALQARAQNRVVGERQTGLQSARLKAAREAAELKRNQELADAARERAWETTDMVTKQENALELQRLRNAGKLSQAAKAAERMKRQEAAMRASWAKGQLPKPLSKGQEDKVSDMVRNLEAVKRVQKNFKPEFVSTIGAIGELQNRAAREFGSLVPEEWRDKANWWRDYQKHLSLPERHEFFGATLTQGEQMAWKQAEVGPGMTKEDMEKNLETRVGILSKVVQRRVISIARSKKNPEAVQDLLGDVLPEFEIPGDIGKEPFPAELEDMFKDMAGEEAAAVSNELSDEELADQLRQQGLDPADYGL